LPRLRINGRHPPLKIVAIEKQVSSHRWKFFNVHINLRFAHGFKPSVCIRLLIKLCRQQAEVVQNHDIEHVHKIGQVEASHRKYMRLKLGDGQAYDRSGD
jgi:hypothetical protein